MCYGGPFIVAFTCEFIETEGRGRIYGPATVRVLVIVRALWVMLIATISCGVG